MRGDVARAGQVRSDGRQWSLRQIDTALEAQSLRVVAVLGSLDAEVWVLDSNVVVERRQPLQRVAFNAVVVRERVEVFCELPVRGRERCGVEEKPHLGADDVRGDPHRVFNFWRRAGREEHGLADYRNTGSARLSPRLN